MISSIDCRIRDSATPKFSLNKFLNKFSVLLSLTLQLLFVSYSSSVWAQSKSDPRSGNVHSHSNWSVRAEIPPVTVIGKASAEEGNQVQLLRQKLIELLRYWKERGIPDPPDLEGFYYIPNWDGVRVVEALQLLNPSIPDIKEHLLRQFEHLQNSLLAKVIREHYEALEIADPDLAILAVFDQWANLRYGLPLEQIIYHVLENSRLGETSVGKGILNDNAFYATHPKLDLTEMLLPAKDGPTRLEIDLAESIDVARTNAIVSNGPHSHRIVILPRTTQEKGDLAVSTVRDIDVSAHELGHKIVDGLTSEIIGRPRRMETSIHEVYADFVVTAVYDPVIGEIFAEASAEIARRIRERGPRSYHEMMLAEYLFELGEQGYLRNFSTPSSIKDLSRIPPEEEHTSANPIRSFIWHLREASGNKPKFDTIAMTALYEFSILPLLYSQLSASLVQPEQITKPLDYLSDEHNYRRAIELNAGQDGAIPEIELDEAERKARWIIELINKVAKEEKARPRQGPPILPDYIIPEFLRVFWRVVEREAPEWKSLVLKEAGAAMNLKAIAIPLQNGREELAFFEEVDAHPDEFVRNEMREHLLRLSEIRKELEALTQAANYLATSRLITSEEIASIRNRLTHPETFLAYLRSLYDEYESTLEKVQEYERTGEPSRLAAAHPVFGGLVRDARELMIYFQKRLGLHLRAQHFPFALGLIKGKETFPSAKICEKYLTRK